ncbi:MAG: ferredoxin [Nocardioides sp.]|nr:ferredoxin [Nocardioides sp.]
MTKVKVDYELCEANALCEAVAPDVFQVDDDDMLHVLDDEVTEENRSRVEQAVASCPRAAISLED